MFKINKLIPLLILVLCGQLSSLQAQQVDPEMLTLFTTQQERQLINSNRYKKQRVTNRVVVVEKPEEEKQVVRQKETISIKLAGVTVSQSGQNVAWINGKAYENGGKLDNGLKVYISNKIKSLVQIKTPDGKYHSVVAGETVDVIYYRRIEG